MRHAAPVTESPSSPIDPSRLVGNRLTEVTTAWFDSDGRNSRQPIHVWLRWHEAGWCMAHTSGAGHLNLAHRPPYESYDMGKNGRVVVEPGGPSSLDQALGARLAHVQQLWQQPPGQFVGTLLGFDNVTIGIANLGDELVVRAWPHADWQQWDVRLPAGGDDPAR